MAAADIRAGCRRAGNGLVLALRFAVELATIAVPAWAGASASGGLPVRIAPEA